MPTVRMIPATINRFTAQPIVQATKRKVAGYARVSTDSDEQFTSYEAQIDYYTTYIKSREEWEFVNVYTDEGVTGTNTKHREGFNRMIEDALAGRIDLIITKSVSRFARNTVDSLTTIRKLKDHNVECFFEKENIWTFDGKGELLITIMSSLAQEESRSISENCTWGQRKRFADGKVSVPYTRFLGYDKGEDGKMVVNEKEAKVVRRIFSLFLQGMTAHGIAKLLTDDGIPTPGHKTKWSARTVSSILSNEKYKGDALLQKSYTVDFLTKKQRRNNGEIQQYYVEGNHEAIIAPEVFDMVQRELALRKPGTNRHSGVRVFSGTVYCAECGGLYGSKLWHSNDKYRRVMWRCNHKYDNDQHCHMPSLTEDELQAAFLSAFNKLLSERDEIQASYELIKEQLYGLKDLESELASISAEEEVAAELITQCIRENARVALNQEDYNTRYQALCSRHDAIQARLDSVEAEINRRRLRRSDIDRFIDDLMRQPAIITTFDPILWSTMVERVTIHGKNDLRFTFRNGTEITA